MMENRKRCTERDTHSRNNTHSILYFCALFVLLTAWSDMMLSKLYQCLILCLISQFPQRLLASGAKTNFTRADYADIYIFVQRTAMPTENSDLMKKAYKLISSLWESDLKISISSDDIRIQLYLLSIDDGIKCDSTMKSEIDDKKKNKKDYDITEEESGSNGLTTFLDKKCIDKASEVLKKPRAKANSIMIYIFDKYIAKLENSKSVKEAIGTIYSKMHSIYFFGISYAELLNKTLIDDTPKFIKVNAQKLTENSEFDGIKEKVTVEFKDCVATSYKPVGSCNKNPSGLCEAPEDINTSESREVPHGKQCVPKTVECKDECCHQPPPTCTKQTNNGKQIMSPETATTGSPSTPTGSSGSSSRTTRPNNDSRSPTPKDRKGNGTGAPLDCNDTIYKITGCILIFGNVLCFIAFFVMCWCYSAKGPMGRVKDPVAQNEQGKTKAPSAAATPATATDSLAHTQSVAGGARPNDLTVKDTTAKSLMGDASLTRKGSGRQVITDSQRSEEQSASLPKSEQLRKELDEYKRNKRQR